VAARRLTLVRQGRRVASETATGSTRPATMTSASTGWPGRSSMLGAPRVGAGWTPRHFRLTPGWSQRQQAQDVLGRSHDARQLLRTGERGVRGAGVGLRSTKITKKLAMLLSQLSRGA